MEHSASLLGVELAGGEPLDDHRQGFPDGLGVVEGMEDVAAEAGAGTDGGAAGAAELLVVMAEGAVSERGRLAETAVGLGVAAEWVFGVSGEHAVPFRRLK